MALLIRRRQPEFVVVLCIRRPTPHSRRTLKQNVAWLRRISIRFTRNRDDIKVPQIVPLLGTPVDACQPVEQVGGCCRDILRIEQHSVRAAVLQGRFDQRFGIPQVAFGDTLQSGLLEYKLRHPSGSCATSSAKVIADVKRQRSASK